MAIYLTIYVKLGLKRYGRFLSGISSPQLGHYCGKYFNSPLTFDSFPHSAQLSWLPVQFFQLPLLE